MSESEWTAREQRRLLTAKRYAWTAFWNTPGFIGLGIGDGCLVFYLETSEALPNVKELWGGVLVRRVVVGEVVPHALETCPRCGQRPEGQGGEYPCPECGLPTLHDEEANEQATA